MDRRHEKPRRVDRPEPGYFLIRLVPGGPEVPAAILYRRGLYAAVVNGRQYGWHAEWPKAQWVGQIWTGRMIDRAEYERRLALAQVPDHPAATPRKRVDLTDKPPLF